MMKSKKSMILFVVLLLVNGVYSQNKKFKIQTIAFYNVENLFDTIDTPRVNDKDFTPTGERRWNTKKYTKKISNIAHVISEIGVGDNNANSPVVIGLSEIENRGVLNDLVKDPKLIDKEYGIIHFDSPDWRGIDVALLYQTRFFQPISSHNIPLIIYNVDGSGKRVYTRDQLLVTGLLDGEEMHFIVNHWPSRVGGEKKSNPYREAAATLNRKIIDSLQTIDPGAKVITMGDMNDGPYNKSIKKVLEAKAKKINTKEFGLYNPMEEMSNKGIGTLAYRDAWELFDQMILTQSFIIGDYSSYTFWKASVFNKSFLTQKTGIYKGYPLRNTITEPGYSDHFPVYIYLIKEVE